LPLHLRSQTPEREPRPGDANCSANALCLCIEVTVLKEAANECGDFVLP
jgi:hypothetical protein